MWAQATTSSDDLMQAGAATDASTTMGSHGSSGMLRPGGPSAAGHRAPSGTQLADNDRPAGSAPEEYNEETTQTASVADRIEGIRACLEARLGTQRFQQLYQSLSLDGGSLGASAVGGADGGNAPIDAAPTAASQMLGLSNVLKAAVANADECESDVGSLAPLVAKLVDCEQRYFS